MIVYKRCGEFFNCIGCVLESSKRNTLRKPTVQSIGICQFYFCANFAKQCGHPRECLAVSCLVRFESGFQFPR